MPLVAAIWQECKGRDVPGGEHEITFNRVPLDVVYGFTLTPLIFSFAFPFCMYLPPSLLYTWVALLIGLRVCHRNANGSRTVAAPKIPWLLWAWDRGHLYFPPAASERSLCAAGMGFRSLILRGIRMFPSARYFARSMPVVCGWGAIRYIEPECLILWACCLYIALVAEGGGAG